MSINPLFSKILVPIDGSEPSFHAARIASNIADKFQSEIIVLYVVVSPSKSEYANLTGLVTPKQIDMIIENAKKESKNWFKRIEDMVKEENSNIKISTKVILTGVAVYGEVIQYAQQESIDLIVIGTRGRSGIKKLLLGSTASGVVTYANCPVLVTK
ncbi:MAG TPA: universal stress protein [Nitrososphaeraceae archaeon]|jgi:nucleotide-binding universal stress UspA family protein